MAKVTRKAPRTMPIRQCCLIVYLVCILQQDAVLVDGFTTTSPLPSWPFRNRMKKGIVERIRNKRCHEKITVSQPLRAAPQKYYQQPFTQVMSDVDDTLKSSGGVNVAGVALGGIDVQYQRGTYYPGVAEFMLQVSLGPTYSSSSSSEGAAKANEQNDQQQQQQPSLLWPAKVAILTARAEEFKMALELKPDSPLATTFRKAGEAVGIQNWGLGPVLYGSVAEWIVQDRKGLRKFNNFERLLKQDPSGAILQYIYVGDTGELDQQAGETMLREYPELVKAVFLHVVSGTVNDIVTVPPPKLIHGRPLVFFRTYVGAATAAVKLGFVSRDGLKRVMDAACQQLNDVPRFSDKWVDMERDIELANKLLSL